MIAKLLGNRSAEQSLLHLFHYGEIHASAIARDYGVAVTPIRQQLERLEDAGVLVSKEIGRARVYSFNPKSPYARLLKDMVRIDYESIPLIQRQKIFAARRRPRRKGKPVYART